MTAMKAKAFFLSALMAAVCLAAGAQNYRNSRYYNPSTGRLDYSKGQVSRTSSGFGQHHYLDPYNYAGLRVGPSFSSIISDDSDFNSTSTKTGLNIGLAAGVSVSHNIPLYLETGLYYTEKGCKQDNWKKYNLQYLEVPVVLKYLFIPDNNFSVQPFIGGYLSGGVGGKVKVNGSAGSGSLASGSANYTYSAFGENGDFNRFDGGLKLGCGIGYDVLYAELSYEYGFTNISKDTFDSTHNSALMLNVGLNF